MPSPKSLSSRLASCTAIATLAFGIAACGDSDDPVGDAAQRSTTPGTTGTTAADAPRAERDEETAPPKSAEASDRPHTTSGGTNAPGEPPRGEDDPQRITQVVKGMYADFAKGDAAGVCEAMSSSTRDQIAKQVFDGSARPVPARTCEESFSKFLTAAAGSGVLERILNVSVGAVSVNGRNATAVVSISGQTGKVRLVQEDGQWRFATSPTAG
jgi:hypothetical protein